MNNSKLFLATLLVKTKSTKHVKDTGVKGENINQYVINVNTIKSMLESNDFTVEINEGMPMGGILITLTELENNQ